MYLFNFEDFGIQYIAALCLGLLLSWKMNLHPRLKSFTAFNIVVSDDDWNSGI